MKTKCLNTPIFVFNDYVDYLQEWYDYARKFGITQKDFITEAGISARAFLSDVLGRRKKIGKKHIDGFIKALKLETDEAEYFSLLVNKEIIRDPRKKAELLRRLAELREQNVSSILDNRLLEYFASWKYPVIREYVVSKGSIKSPKEIVNGLINLKLSSRDVEVSLKKLQKWNMVTYDEKRGEYRPAQKDMTFSYDKMPHAVVNDVKRTMIETSVQAMELLEKDQRHVSLAIRGLNEESYRQLCIKIDNLRREFLEIAVLPLSADRIVALNIQAFPVISVASMPGSGGRRG